MNRCTCIVDRNLKLVLLGYQIATADVQGHPVPLIQLQPRIPEQAHDDIQLLARFCPWCGKRLEEVP